MMLNTPTTTSRGLPLFATLVMLTEFADPTPLNQALADWVRSQQRRQTGMQRTNVGGWHSEKFPADLPEPAVQAFLAAVRPALSEWAAQTFQLSSIPDPAAWQIEFWANCNRRGHYNKAHDHFRADIIASAFYYVQSGGDQVGGRTVFINQQSVPPYVELGIDWRDREYALTPKDGTLVIFPSWLGHKVEPFQGDGDRITLALNAGHPMLPVQKRGEKPRLAWLRTRLRALLRMVSKA